jgi:hypothetical protein
MREFCRLTGTHKTKTSAYHPASDGMVERYNATLLRMLRAYVNEAQDDWDEYLPVLMMAYRSAVHRSTGYTPNFLMFGREIVLPSDLALGVAVPQTGETPDEYVFKLRERMRMINHICRKHLDSAAMSAARYYNRKAAYRSFAVGDAVVYNDVAVKIGHTKKLQDGWFGPYVVIARLGDVTYVIQAGPRTRAKIIQVNRLEKYTGKEEVTWYERMRAAGRAPRYTQERVWKEIQPESVPSDAPREPVENAEDTDTGERFEVANPVPEDVRYRLADDEPKRKSLRL